MSRFCVVLVEKTESFLAICRVVAGAGEKKKLKNLIGSTANFVYRYV